MCREEKKRNPVHELELLSFLSNMSSLSEVKYILTLLSCCVIFHMNVHTHNTVPMLAPAALCSTSEFTNVMWRFVFVNLVVYTLKFWVRAWIYSRPSSFLYCTWSNRLFMGLLKETHILSLWLEVTVKPHHFHSNTCRSARSARRGWTSRVTWPLSCQDRPTFVPFGLFVRLPSLHRYQGGSELMDGERQHVTQNSTLQCGAIPTELQQPAHVTWQLCAAATGTLPIGI